MFFDLNRFVLDAPDDDAYELIIAVTTGTVDHAEAARTLATWTSVHRR